MITYKPVASKGFAWGLGLLVFCLVIVLLPVALSLKAGGGNWAFILTMSTLLLFMIALIGYFVWAAKNLSYFINDNDLIIRWAFNEKCIPLNSITGLQKIVGTSSMKVAGASWPGFHWGSFTSPTGQGTVNLYATRIWGEILLIKTKWETIGITPEDTDRLIENIQELVPGLGEGDKKDNLDETRPQFSPWRDKIFLGLVALSGLLIIGTGLFLAKTIPGLPSEVPMHYNLAGEVNRYGSPKEIWNPFGIGVLVNVLMLGLTMTIARNNKMSAYMMGAVSVFVSLIFCLIAISMAVSA